MADKSNIGQADIDQMLAQSGARTPNPGAVPRPAVSASDPQAASEMPNEQIESLLSGLTSPGAAGTPGEAPETSAKTEPSAAASQSQPAANDPGTPRTARTSATSAETDPQLAQGDVEFLLKQASEALASIEQEGGPEPPSGMTPFRFHEFGSSQPPSEGATLDLIRDVELDVKIELGRTHMYLEDVLKLRKGSVVALEKLAGDPVDIYVNDRLVARGEVLVLNDSFCVRVAELVAGESPEAV